MQAEKLCFRCNTSKPVDEFYRHPQMADGHLGKCKECAKTDVLLNRTNNAEYYKQFDRDRAYLPHRVTARKAYAKTPEGQAAQTRRTKKWAALHPDQKHAMTIVGNAVRDGRMTRLPCSRCDTPNAHAHHPDYSKPLEVIWLCPQCHCDEHKRLRALA